MLLYTLGNLNGREAERREQTPAAYSEPAKAAAQQACAGGEPAAMFECVYERAEASNEQAYAEQDLSAQQRAATSSLAAAVIALFTLGATIAGVWLVKRTLDATLEAVADTGKATNAMIRQNEIAEQAQRPWVIITVGKPTLKPHGKAIMLRIPIVFQNIGKTVAVGFWPHVKVYAAEAEFETRARINFDVWRHPKGSSKRILMPGETSTHTPFMGFNVEHLPWFGEGEDRRVNIVIQAAAFYYSEGRETFDERLFTERTFRIGTEGDNWYASYVIFARQLDAYETIDFVATQCGPRDAR